MTIPYAQHANGPSWGGGWSIAVPPCHARVPSIWCRTDKRQAPLALLRAPSSSMNSNALMWVV